ncbi:MAG: preprotein translocase subunit SecA [Chloroflexota bacterium]|nr:preprotein translocase subunit SecA [Chloroflexota bacterium]
MFKNIAKALGGDPQKREIDRVTPLIDQINQLEPEYETLSPEALRDKTAQFRQRLAEGETLDDVLVEAFAAVREASKRTTGLRHFDIQMIGGIFLHEGKIVEMRTGEGKTLVATLPLYLNALAGRGAHLVTVNDYLARRDARWMAPIYDYLGMQVGVLQMSSRTESAQFAYMVDLARRDNREEDDQLRMVYRRDAYAADITYGTNNEFGFDYLRDNLVMDIKNRVQREHAYAIVDEVDNILIDEARTPLIISGPASEDVEWYNRMAVIVRQLNPEDYDFNEKDRSVSLTEIGETHVEDLLQIPLRDPDRPEDITPEQARLLGHLEQALKAQLLYKKNKDYIIQNGEIIIVDEFTGRLMPGRRWSEGLHQAVEAKEGVKVQPENVTHATITLQNYFRMYDKLAGMTGTALTEAEEFATIYKLDAVEMPTNLDYRAGLPEEDLEVFQEKDEEGYAYTYYALGSDAEKQALYWKRKDYHDVVYRTEEAKLRAIVLEILKYHLIGRPILVGTTSIEHSELLSSRLSSEALRRLLMAVLVRESWLETHEIKTIEKVIPELDFLNQPVTSLVPDQMRRFAREFGQESINPDSPENLAAILNYLSLPQDFAPRLDEIIRGGIQHQVLNALKHDQESQIIADAGAFGAVTIATNMAGRGVDIKLGGEIRESVLSDVRQFLNGRGIDPYGLSNADMAVQLKQIPAEEYGESQESIETFLTFLDNMNRVRALGGLHVIGSERHEARRIDNQLRGRAARQGDPGSSRFYLSLEDDLMRMFGGDRAENLMRVFSIDPSIPLESRMLGRLVEQAQERVEGNNFDIRKHLLDYDDVLNDQRERIYAERDRVLVKEDLEEDVLDMLHTELQRRIPDALQDEEGPWKLLAFLEEIQPTIFYQQFGENLPSYTLSLIHAILEESISDLQDPAAVEQGLLDLAERAIQAESRHVRNQTSAFIQRTADSFTTQIEERLDLLDIFVENNQELFESSPKEYFTQLQNQVHLKLNLDSGTTQAMKEDPDEIPTILRTLVEETLLKIVLGRMIMTIERRVNSRLTADLDQLATLDWPSIEDRLLSAVDQNFQDRLEQLHKPESQIQQNIQVQLRKQQEAGKGFNLDELATGISVGTQAAIDPRTRQKINKRVALLNYIYLAALELENEDPEVISANILAHLERTQVKMQHVWGKMEIQRVSENIEWFKDLPQDYRANLAPFMEEGSEEVLNSKPLKTLLEENNPILISTFGRYVQQTIYRHILLRAISDLWIEQLTRMEALRISIGMEAYAQLDPLVQYKSKSTDAFKDLFADIRMGVISRMFRLQPAKPVVMNPEAPAAQNAGAAQNSSSQNTKKHKRKKHKKH